MKVAPLKAAILAAKAEAPKGAQVVYLSPQGLRFQQSAAKSLMQTPLIFVCGRYEGIDERLIQSLVDQEWSIGDFVLSGGEIPAMVMIDAMARLVPGVLGDEESAVQDSFSHSLLDCPHYTKPAQFDQQSVPEVLLSGHHQNIERWRAKQALGRTWERRPDLLENLALTDTQAKLLAEYIHERNQTE
jgi:tRNA (guanine37-N1)-methyltransferase